MLQQNQSYLTGTCIHMMSEKCTKTDTVKLQTHDWQNPPHLIAKSNKMWQNILGKQRGPWRQGSVSTRQLSEEERQRNQQLPIMHGPISII